MALRTFYFKVMTSLAEHDLNLSLTEMLLSSPLSLFFYAFRSVLPVMLRMKATAYVLGIGEKLVGFSSDCIVMIVKVQGQGMDNLESNSAARDAGKHLDVLKTLLVGT